MKFNVGDWVWYCDKGKQKISVTCPDCLGSGKLTVIMGDGTHIGIDCECCRHGYEYTGLVTRYQWDAKCRQSAITGMEINGTKVEYHIGDACCYRIFKEDELFTTQEEAEVYAEIAKAEHEIEDEQQFQRKVKEHKNWAWNATYHRGQLRDLKERLEYHQKKLEVAKSKAKV